MSQNSETKPLSPLSAFGVLLAVIALIVGFIGLVALFNITEVWAGFLFLLYWGVFIILTLKNTPPPH